MSRKCDLSTSDCYSALTADTEEVIKVLRSEPAALITLLQGNPEAEAIIYPK